MADDEQTDEAPQPVLPKNFLKDTLQHARGDGDDAPSKSFNVIRVQEDYREQED